MKTKYEEFLESIGKKEQDDTEVLKTVEEELKSIENINDKLDFICKSSLSSFDKTCLMWEEINKDRIKNPSEETLKEVERITTILQEKGYYKLEEPRHYNSNNATFGLVYFQFEKGSYTYQEDRTSWYYETKSPKQISLEGIKNIIKVKSVDGWR